jgi:uncharacterized protein (TIGR00369 family)
MTAFIKKHFSAANHPLITHVAQGHVKLRLDCTAAERRPGGFISGPTMMAMADTAGLMGVFSHTGMTAPAFTTALSIDFLRTASGISLLADAKVVKFGRMLSIINVSLRGSDSDKISAQAVVTYATSVGAQ